MSSSDQQFKDQICDMPQYKCLDVNVYYVTYNCIGWAFGVSKWLQPSKITNDIKFRNMTHKQAIQKFVNEVNRDYPSEHISNIADVANKFDISSLSTNMVSPSNNTLSLYFDGDTCLHGSRFLNTIKGQELDQWTSKLGKEILLSHNEEDLLYNGSPYGDSAYYIGITDNNIKD